MHHLARPPASPIRIIADVVVNKVQVQPGRIRADGVFTTLPGGFFKRIQFCFSWVGSYLALFLCAFASLLAPFPSLRKNLIQKRHPPEKTQRSQSQTKTLPLVVKLERIPEQLHN